MIPKPHRKNRRITTELRDTLDELLFEALSSVRNSGATQNVREEEAAAVLSAALTDDTVRGEISLIIERIT